MPLKCRLMVCRRNTLMARVRLKAIEPVNWFLNFLFTSPFTKFTLLNGKEEEYPGDDRLEEAGLLAKLFPENEPLCSVDIKGERCHWLWTLNTDLMRFLISLWCSWDLHELKVVAKVGRFILNVNAWERGVNVVRVDSAAHVFELSGAISWTGKESGGMCKDFLTAWIAVQ